MGNALNTCGCCEGTEPLTPASVENRPGLSALVYRVGTHGRFKETMLSQLAAQPALRELTTRADDDPSVALLDAWAVALDVLSFYQERIANEGYLRTATEQRSILEMARSIGYELGPGVAASTYLAFTLENMEGAPLEATISVGSKVQSIPGQDEKPQLFETTEEIGAKAAWNAMKPRAKALKLPGFGDTVLYLKGISTNLRKGDTVLYVGDEREDDPGNEHWDFRRVAAVETVPPTEPTTDPYAGYTAVTLDHGLGTTQPYMSPAAENPTVYALRQRAALFGYNAPDWNAMPKDVKKAYGGTGYTRLDNWPHFNIAYTDPVPVTIDTVYLDALYPQILVGSWFVLVSPDYTEVYTVESIAEDSKTEFTLTAKTTRVQLEGENLKKKFQTKLRETVVYAQSEQLELAEQPITDVVSGNSVVLDQEVEELYEDQRMIISGTDSETGESVSEVVTLEGTALTSDGYTQLTFTSALQYSYERERVTIYGNVAPATHGETKSEVLGSGDGARSFQAFMLKQTPLTYVSAATASGAETTLEVRVNNILWEEVPSLYQQPSDARVYITRMAVDGKVTVRFGDGITGARLPTGIENVKATYRVGTGLDGLVTADQLSLLMTRPLGVKAVTNPLAPTGAADPEEEEEARANAPLTVLTLDRIVSLQDYEDFSRAFAGIAKAQATLLWSGEQRIVHITVAGVNGAEVEETSDLYTNLLAAIDAARHANHTVALDTYSSLLFTLSAKVKVDADYIVEDVLEEVNAAIEEAFSFESRVFGQAVISSEVLAVMQGVEGVIAVDLDLLNGVDPAIKSRIPVHIARWNQTSEEILPAELLTVDPDNIILTEMTA